MMTTRKLSKDTFGMKLGSIFLLDISYTVNYACMCIIVSIVLLALTTDFNLRS